MVIHESLPFLCCGPRSKLLPQMTSVVENKALLPALKKKKKKKQIKTACLLICIFAFTFGCIGLSPLCAVRAERGLPSEHGVPAPHCGAFSWRSAWVPGHSGSVAVVPGLGASWRVGSSRTRDRTHVLCTSRWILNHWSTREVSPAFFWVLCIYYEWIDFWSFMPRSSEKAMAPHSSTLAWKIPWTEEPVRLQSMGLLRVLHDWATSLSLFTFMHWRRKWQPTPVFLPGESQGRASLVGCRLWGHTELDTTEVT